IIPTHSHETLADMRRFSAGAISGMRISIFFTYPLELLHVCMAFHTIDSSASGSAQQPSSLQTARFIYSEGVALPTLTTPIPIKRDVFHPPASHNFSVSLVGIVPDAGTGFLTWDYLHAATLVPISVSPEGRGSQVSV
ncbi:hypothetical protein V8E53_009851, partial [Lactarius tabidus]